MLNWDFFCVRKKKKTAVEVRQWFAIFWRLTWNDCVYIPWNVWIVYFQTLWFFNLDEEGGVINAQRLCFYVKTKSVLRFDNLLSYNKKGYLCNNRKWSNFPIQFDKLFALAIMLTQTSQFVHNSVTYVRRQNALSLYTISMICRVKLIHQMQINSICFALLRRHIYTMPLVLIFFYIIRYLALNKLSVYWAN